MTRGSIREYTEAVQERYFLASEKEKGMILDEFTQVTGYHCKAAIRLLHRGSQPRTSKRRGRPRQYDVTVAGTLRVVWEATDRLCSKRLYPFLPVGVSPKTRVRPKIAWETFRTHRPSIFSYRWQTNKT